MRRPNSSYRRGPSRPREERRVIRIYAEGSVTEYDYLQHWEQLCKGVTLEWGESGLSPVGLVSRAKADIKTNQRAKRGQGAPNFDEIWCVFDVDDHSHVPNAVFEAGQSDIGVAVSNPCFELWLVLHCEERARHVDRRDIQRDARNLHLIEGKNVPDSVWGRLEDGYEDAKRRARSLDQMHAGNESPPRSNPSTGVWRLVDSIRQGSDAVSAEESG